MKKKEFIAAVIAVATVVFMLIFTDLFHPFGQVDSLSATTDSADSSTLPGGVRIEELSLGQGKAVNQTSSITIHYTITLTDGTKIESTHDLGQPLRVSLGQNSLIKGFEEGVIGMKVGGLRRIIIPPALAYGNQAIGSIPANSTLIFEVELLAVE
jgi:FKBP-type peptidyl-prolyl cis-trans isomerase